MIIKQSVEYNPNMISLGENSQYTTENQMISLPVNFFNELIQAQQVYGRNRDKQTMSILLGKYTDLVAYFEAKHEPATQYFQAKIKALISNVKFFTHTPADLERNRAKLNKDMCNVMETEMDKVHKDWKANIQKQKRISRKVDKILTDQTIKLDERIKNSRRRSCIKSNSCKNTLSFATLTSYRNYKQDTQFHRRLPDKGPKIVSSSCISQKYRIDEDIQKYFEEGAVIAGFSEESDNEISQKEKRRDRLREKRIR